MSTFIKIELLGLEHSEGSKREAPNGPDDKESQPMDTRPTTTAVKRVRTRFTKGQKEILLQHFTRDIFLSGTERSRLADELGLPQKTVKIWFQNQRIKFKKENATSPPSVMVNNAKVTVKEEVATQENQDSNVMETPRDNGYRDYDQQHVYRHAPSLMDLSQDGQSIDSHTNCYNDIYKDPLETFPNDSQQQTECLQFPTQTLQVPDQYTTMKFSHEEPTVDALHNCFNNIHKSPLENNYLNHIRQHPEYPHLFAQNLHVPHHATSMGLSQDRPFIGASNYGHKRRQRTINSKDIRRQYPEYPHFPAQYDTLMGFLQEKPIIEVSNCDSKGPLETFNSKDIFQQNWQISNRAFSMNLSQYRPCTDTFKNHYYNIQEEHSLHPHYEYMPQPSYSTTQYRHVPKQEPLQNLIQEVPVVESISNIPGRVQSPALDSRGPQQSFSIKLKFDQAPHIRGPIVAGSNPINNGNYEYIPKPLHSTEKVPEPPVKLTTDADSNINDPELTHFPQQAYLMGLSQDGLRLDTSDGAFIDVCNYTVDFSEFPADLAVS